MSDYLQRDFRILRYVSLTFAVLSLAVMCFNSPNVFNVGTRSPGVYTYEDSLTEEGPPKLTRLAMSWGHSRLIRGAIFSACLVTILLVEMFVQNTGAVIVSYIVFTFVALLAKIIMLWGMLLAHTSLIM